MKAGIAEDYKAACDSSGNWVACAIYAAYIEDSDQKHQQNTTRRHAIWVKRAQTMALIRYCKNHATNPLAENILNSSKFPQPEMDCRDAVNFMQSI
ncbi:hypothetical protein CSHOW_1897 [Campylobacter showae]|uniref:hypothetical protein n=1 Tax=Campylobacter showae TaxID=204 RepID=UPI0005877AB7|nr:hypothetical protein [Campylobacter showae]QCD49791.1 hypothetical protein CSHOW_1897 [Campylobacter showae]